MRQTAPNPKKKKVRRKKVDRRKKRIPQAEAKLEHIGHYNVLKVLGKGGFGTVYECFDSQVGRTVAIKQVSLHGMTNGERENIRMEMELLRELKNEHIVTYLDMVPEDQTLNIVLEYIESGQLSSLLAKIDGGPPEALIAKYTYQILEGLDYLHKQGVIHRDIKGANILTTKEGLVKLADFGLATKLNEQSGLDDAVGTPYWMAPEIIELRSHSPECDIWSVGCTVIELLTGKPPYFDLNAMAALYRIVQDSQPPLPPGISHHLEDFLKRCFKKDPQQRPGAAMLMDHPWLKSAKQSNSPSIKSPMRNASGEYQHRKTNLAELRLLDNALANLKSNDIPKLLQAYCNLGGLALKHGESIRVTLLRQGVMVLVQPLERENNSITEGILTIITSLLINVSDDDKGQEEEENPTIRDFREALMVIGFIPKLVTFTSNEYSMNVRMYSTALLRVFCFSDEISFCKSNGLPGLFLLLKGATKSTKDMQFGMVALECIEQLLHSQDVCLIQNDLRYMLSSMNLISILINLLQKLQEGPKRLFSSLDRKSRISRHHDTVGRMTLLSHRAGVHSNSVKKLHALQLITGFDEVNPLDQSKNIYKNRVRLSIASTHRKSVVNDPEKKKKAFSPIQENISRKIISEPIRTTTTSITTTTTKTTSPMPPAPKTTTTTTTTLSSLSTTTLTTTIAAPITDEHDSIQLFHQEMCMIIARLLNLMAQPHSSPAIYNDFLKNAEGIQSLVCVAVNCEDDKLAYYLIKTCAVLLTISSVLDKVFKVYMPAHKEPPIKCSLMVFVIKFLKRLNNNCRDSPSWEWAVADALHCISCLCKDSQGDNLRTSVDLNLVHELQSLLQRRPLSEFSERSRSLTSGGENENSTILFGEGRKTANPVDLIRFTFPLLFRIATSPREFIREKFQEDKPETLKTLLTSEHYRSETLDILRQWMLDDAAKVEMFVCKAGTIEIIVSMMADADPLAYYNILGTLAKMISTSIKTSLVYGKSKILLQELCLGLSKKYTTNEYNNIRIATLKIIHHFLSKAQKPDQTIKELNFVKVLTDLSEDKSAIIVSKLAKALLDQFFAMEDLEDPAPGTRKYVKKEIKKCMICTKKFGILTRKHYCKHCQYVICGDCSPDKFILPDIDKKKPARICKTCAEFLTQKGLSPSPRPQYRSLSGGTGDKRSIRDKIEI